MIKAKPEIAAPQIPSQNTAFSTFTSYCLNIFYSYINIKLKINCERTIRKLPNIGCDSTKIIIGLHLLVDSLRFELPIIIKDAKITNINICFLFDSYFLR